jgi:hypothetical protein
VTNPAAKTKSIGLPADALLSWFLHRHLDNFIVTRKSCPLTGTVQKHMPTLTLRCALGRLRRQLPIPPGRYRQAVDFHDSSCMTTKNILHPRHINLDMTNLCFLSGLCPHTKILKSRLRNLNTFANPHKPPHKTKGLQKSAILPML